MVQSVNPGKGKTFLLPILSAFFIFTLCFTVPVHAATYDGSLAFDSFEYNDMEFNEYGAREALFYGDNSSASSVIIPEKVVDEAGNTRTVVGIADLQVADDADVAVPSTVKFVHNASYSTLRSIHFLKNPDLTLEDTSFSNCENLITVRFEEVGKLTIENEVFANCTKLPNISLPDGTVSIGEQAFAECTSLNRMSFPKNATVSADALYRCFNVRTIDNAPGALDLGYRNEGTSEQFKVESISFRPGITEVEGIYAEIYPDGGGEVKDDPLPTLTRITIPAGVTSVSDLGGFTGLTAVTLPAGLKTVGGSAFEDCKNLRSLNLPDSITKIGDSAFRNCTALTGITRLPSSIKEVENFAFYGCKNLKMSVNHPGNNLEYQYKNSGITAITLNLSKKDVNTVYPGGLTGCPNLKSITVKGDSNFKSIDGVLYVPVFDRSGKFLGLSLAKYPAGKSGGKYTIPKEALALGGFAFEGCKFSEIHIPVTVRTMFSDYMASIDATPESASLPSYTAFDNMASSPTVYYVRNSYATEFYYLENYSKTKTEYGPSVKITYDLKGGKNASSNPASFIAGKSVTLAAPTRSGYTFDGWLVEYISDKGTSVEEIYYGDLEGSTVTPTNEHLVSGLKLIAKWKEEEGLKAGASEKVSGNTYKITKAANGNNAGEVTFTKAKNKKSISIPKTVKLSDGKIYKVTAVGKNAFKGKKIRTVTVGANVKKLASGAFSGSKTTKIVLKTKGLTKKSVKGSLKKSKVKTVQVKIGKKSVNKKYIKKYKKIFTKKNAGAKVTVK